MERQPGPDWKPWSQCLRPGKNPDPSPTATTQPGAALPPVTRQLRAGEGNLDPPQQSRQLLLAWPPHRPVLGPQTRPSASGRERPAQGSVLRVTGASSWPPCRGGALCPLHRPAGSGRWSAVSRPRESRRGAWACTPGYLKLLPGPFAVGRDSRENVSQEEGRRGMFWGDTRTQSLSREALRLSRD